MLNTEFIKRKVALITEELERLSEFKHLTLDETVKDFRIQATVERLLERVITRAIDINQHLLTEKGVDLQLARTYRETFLRLADIGVYPHKFAVKLAPSAGLRNALVHDYNNIDKKILHKSITEAIVEFNQYGKYVLAFVENQER